MKKFSTLCPCCSCKNFLPIKLIKRVKVFFKKNCITFFLIKDKLTNWRIRAKLAVRYFNKKLTLGLFKTNSHQIISIKNCKAHHLLINKIASLIESKANFSNIIPYDEGNFTGELRYVQISVSKTSQIVLVVNQKKISKKVEKLIKLLSQNKLIGSIWINYNTAKNNVIFTDQWEHIFGDDYLILNILNKNFAFHPAAFLQAHLQIFTKMIKYIKANVDNGTNILELYAGVGVIGLSLIDKCKSLTLVEINPFSKLSFERSLKLSFSNYKHKVSYECMDASEFNNFAKFKTIILDPPRKGLSKKLLKNIVLLKNKTIIYISCNFSSFESDVNILQENGWRLIKAKCFLMFPGSDHIEIVGVLKK